VLLNDQNIPIARDYWPTTGWRTSSPEAQQIEGSALLKVDDIIRADYPETQSLVVIRHGYLVFERYYDDFDHDKKRHIRSITKSFISALIGIALKEGYLSSLDQKVADLLPEYFKSDTDPRKKTITLRYLLTMTAGFACDDTDSNFWIIRGYPDWAEAALNFPLINEPGQTFVYDSAAMHLLSVILTRQTRSSAFQFAKTRLFEPLGMQVNDWPADPQHNSEGPAGLMLTPHDMAKFGYLYLNGGQWDGQEIVPEWFVRESTREHSAGGNPEPAAYGYLWWVVSRHSAYCAAGYGGQYVFVIPDRDLIIVTTGNHTLVPPPEAPVPLFFQHIVPASASL
jgi:CubicO group peptidase (beta-lactamase class C family)